MKKISPNPRNMTQSPQTHLPHLNYKYKIAKQPVKKQAQQDNK